MIAFLLSNWRTVGVLALVFILGSYAGVTRLQRDHARAELASEHAEFETFKVKVAAEGEIARQRAAAITAHDELLKEEADHDHQVALDKLRADVGRMRDERDRASGSRLSAPAAPTAEPNRVCFARDKLDLALRELDKELLGIVEVCSTAIISLENAAAWAKALNHDQARTRPAGD